MLTQEVKEKALREHERLSRLFVEDRLSFEQERKRRIAKVITGGTDEESRTMLLTAQKNLDLVLQNACSEENRFVLMKMFFRNHFHEVWAPFINKYSWSLKKHHQPRLCLIRGNKDGKDCEAGKY